MRCAGCVLEMLYLTDRPGDGFSVIKQSLEKICVIFLFKLRWNLLGSKCAADSAALPSGHIFFPVFQVPHLQHNQFVPELKTSLSNFLQLLL